MISKPLPSSNFEMLMAPGGADVDARAAAHAQRRVDFDPPAQAVRGIRFSEGEGVGHRALLEVVPKDFEEFHISLPHFPPVATASSTPSMIACGRGGQPGTLTSVGQVAIHGALDGVAFAEHAAADGADAHGHGHLGLGDFVPDAQDLVLDPRRERPGDEHDVRVAGAPAVFAAEALHVVTGDAGRGGQFHVAPVAGARVDAEQPRRAGGKFLDEVHDRPPSAANPHQDKAQKGQPRDT